MTFVKEGLVRRFLVGVVPVLALIASASTALALAPQRQRKTLDNASGNVSAVTDAAGNSIKLGPLAAAPRIAEPAAPKSVRRGQAWWPYATPLAPYTVGKRVESMTEDEIMVNGVVTLDVRDPGGALSRMPADLVLDEGSQLRQTEGYYLVKIKGASRTQEQIDALEAAGAVLGEYLNVNTYIAKIPTRDYGAVEALPFVAFVGDYHPTYKISPRIGREEIPVSEAFDEAGRLKPWGFEVVLHKGADPHDVLDRLAHLGLFPRPEEIVSNDTLTVVLVQSDPAAIPSLAMIPGVKWIAERTYPHLLASSASPATIPMILQNNGAFTTSTGTGWKLWNAGIDGNASGTAQIITMEDTGLNTEVEHFSQDTASVGTLGPSHRKVVGYDTDGGDQCVNAYTTADGGHGTWTSEHAAGSISNMAANPDTTHTPTVNFDLGIAREAKIYFRDIGDPSGAIHPPLDLGPGITTAIGKGSFIENNSWGAATPTYDTQASNLDTALFNNPNFVVTVAAGNEGAGGTSTILSPATAKNIISVGGNDAAVPGSLFIDCNWDGVSACSGPDDLGSSRGPVSGSGRTKPDIMTFVAFSSTVGGEEEAGNQPHAMCQSDATKTVYWDFQNLNGLGGTSFAAPEAAGLAALVRDYFLAGYYPTGTATPANVRTPSGSLVKAVILASGEDMSAAASPTTSVAIAKRYSSDVGYGRANLPSVLHIGSSAPFLTVQNNDALGQSATKTTFYNINSNSIPLRVMMAYYDAAGDALQKDCDLKVTIGANVYWGNNFSSGWSTNATTRDHTNNTEGVFLDAAHGLPPSGTVRVDVIGFNDPGGMNYSLVVAGDVVSQSVTSVSLDRGTYTCSQDVQITVNDAGATSPVSVTLTSRNSSSAIIDTKTVSCSGSAGVFTGTIHAGSGIIVADGGTITATYSTASPATATIICQLNVADSGFSISGGCDNSAAGTDIVTGPLTSGGVNEFYTKYMDGGEYNSYTVRFTNLAGVALSDARVTLSFSGAGASKMTVYNSPVHVGAVPFNGTAAAVFQVRTDPSVAGMTAVNMNFDITSPGDGYTTVRRLTQVQLLQTNDVIARQNRCSTFNGGLSPWVEAVVGTHPTNPWRWSGSATAPGTVSSENRTDGVCSSGVTNAAAMVGNSGIASGNNFTGNADSFLLQNFQPALTGNGPSGQPYHYAWKWHSFYHATETKGATTGAWGTFYNDQWNSAVNPTGDQAQAFPIAVAYYYQNQLDYVGTWNWETANTGTPDNPNLSSSTTPPSAPNQLFIVFDGVTGLATSSTYFAYGHEHTDVTLFGGTSSATTRRDIAIDNDNLVYDEFYAAAQAGASCGPFGQVGQVAFDQGAYAGCPTGTAVLSVTDANAKSPLHVTVTSPGTGDHELVTLTGSPPYFSGTLTLSTNSGRGINNGVLLVLPSETISATYADASPVGSTTATAAVECSGGDVVYVASVQVSDNGDNDGLADNGETVTMDITIQSNLASALTNTKVTISTDSPTIDCIGDNHAFYGTVGPGALATNPPGDRFTFHVAPSTDCSDPLHPPTARFTVSITGDGLDGPAALQTFTVDLDLDPTSTGGAYNYSQNFDTNPFWTTGVTPPDNADCSANTYTNDFHWCAVCGNAGAGYGAWVGNSVFGTSGQNYSEIFNSSTLYSPVFTANGNVTLQFDVAYRTEQDYDAGIVQYKVGSGAWTDLPFTTPAQTATQSASNLCSPILLGDNGWTGAGVSWSRTNAATATASSGQTIQFRWRLGSDSSANGTGYGGLGVDNVTITNLKQTVACEQTRNTGLPGCVASCSEVNNSVNVTKSGTLATISWSDPYGGPYGLYRGTRTAAPWSYNQTCLAVVNSGSSGNDGAPVTSGTGAYYLVTRKSPCGESVPGRDSSGAPIPNTNPCP